MSALQAVIHKAVDLIFAAIVLFREARAALRELASNAAHRSTVKVEREGGVSRALEVRRTAPPVERSTPPSPSAQRVTITPFTRATPPPVPPPNPPSNPET